MVNVSVQCVFNVVVVVIVVIVVDALNCGQVVKIPYRGGTILLCAVHRCVRLLLYMYPIGGDGKFLYK